MSASRPLRSPSGTSGRPATFRDVVAAYVGLTKPRVIELLLLTTVPVMFFAARGVPPLGWSSRPSSAARSRPARRRSLNCVYDRDIDEQMRRTRRRALPRHIVSPRAALVFGFVLGVLSTVVLGGVGQPALGRAVACWPNAFYVLRLHDAAQAAHDAEHRLGRPRRLLPGADRLDRGHRRAVVGAGRAVRWSSSSGRRRTPGRWRCATARTTPTSTCRCCRWSRRPPRSAARSCSTAG